MNKYIVVCIIVILIDVKVQCQNNIWKNMSIDIGFGTQLSKMIITDPTFAFEMEDYHTSYKFQVPVNYGGSGEVYYDSPSNLYLSVLFQISDKFSIGGGFIDYERMFDYEIYDLYSIIINNENSRYTERQSIIAFPISLEFFPFGKKNNRLKNLALKGGLQYEYLVYSNFTELPTLANLSRGDYRNRHQSSLTLGMSYYIETEYGITGDNFNHPLYFKVELGYRKGLVNNVDVDNNFFNRIDGKYVTNTNQVYTYYIDPGFKVDAIYINFALGFKLFESTYSN